MSTAAESAEPVRPHTGRRRNDLARAAVLKAARELVRTKPYREVTVEAIAKAARVGKQTVYRWWGSRAEIILESLVEESHGIADRQPSTGPLVDRLTIFLRDTIVAISGDEVEPGAGPVLRALMAEAQASDAIRDRFRDGFTASRRADLRAVLASGIEEGSLAADTDLELLIDMAFGAIWYRLLLGHGAGMSDWPKDLHASS
jgi:AcrR family transcriptional regulator